MPAWLRREREQWAPSAAVFRSGAGLAVKTALIGIFLCHALFLINGYTSPDGTNEGLFFFWNQRWALSLGRWMMEYLSESVYNVVMPPVYLAFNGLCAAGVILLLADLWKIRSRVFLVFGSLSLVVALAVIWQNLVIHVAYSYGFAMLMAVLAVYLIFSKRGAVSFGAAVVCLVLSMGTYQAEIGFATGTVLCTLMLWCLQELPLAQLAQKTGKALAMGILGGVVYFVILQEESARYGVPISDRGGLSSFGAGSLLNGLVENAHLAYHDFKQYFTSGPNHLGKAQLLVLLAAVVLLGLGFLRLVRRRKPQAAVLAVLGVLLPLGINVIDVLTGTEQNYLMSYPMQLMIPFVLMLAWRETAPGWWKGLVRFGAGAAAFLVCWISVVTAYATYHTVALAYRYVDTLTNAILTSVLTDEDYTPDTRVLIAGLPDESQAQKFNFLYDSSCYQGPMVFWSGTNGVLGNWKNYIYDYHGLWIGEVATDEYYDIIDSDDFAAMPVYPAEGSLQKFDDILVVKLQEDPPR